MRDTLWRALFGTPWSDAREMLAALWQGLESSGSAVRRTTVALRTLHPQLVGLGYIWESGRDVVCNEHPHGELALPRF